MVIFGGYDEVRLCISDTRARGDDFCSLIKPDSFWDKHFFTGNEYGFSICSHDLYSVLITHVFLFLLLLRMIPLLVEMRTESLSPDRVAILIDSFR